MYMMTRITEPMITYSFTFFQNIIRARLRLVLRKVTDCKMGLVTTKKASSLYATLERDYIYIDHVVFFGFYGQKFTYVVAQVFSFVYEQLEPLASHCDVI